MAKKSEAEAMVAAIPEGGFAVSGSGSVKVYRGSGEEAEGFRWISSRGEVPVDADGVADRLMRINSEVLEKWTIVEPDGATDYDRERTAKDEAVAERVGLTKAAATVETSTTKGAAKRTATAKVIEVPEGFTLGAGAEATPGDLIVTDDVPERITKIGSGGVSRGRSYLKLMLEPVEGGEVRRRFISPRKEYPLQEGELQEGELQEEVTEETTEKAAS